MRSRQLLITAAQWLWACGLFVACYVGITAFFNWLLGEHRPLWTGVVTGAILIPGTWLLMYAERRGWIKGFSSNRLEFERRQKELADAREVILAEAKAKPHN